MFGVLDQMATVYVYWVVMCARIQAEESAAPHVKSDFSVKKILLYDSIA